MGYGHFIDGGKEYEICTPAVPGAWNNHLWNASYYLEISQTLQGAGSVVKDYNRTPCLSGYRYFYLLDRESGEVWNPNYVPLAKTPDSYRCRHGIWTTRLDSRQHGIEATIQVMVPQEGSREIWSVTLRNLEEKQREISLYSVFGFYDHGVMGGECSYDADSEVILKYAFPYHTLYEEKEQGERSLCFWKPERLPAKKRCLPEKRDFAGNRQRKNLPKRYWEKLLGGFHMETPDEDLNAFGNYWLKKQVALLTIQNRGSSYCPVRNQLQDAMGYALICPEDAESYFLDILKLQRKDGFIQQWHDTAGAPPRGLCLLKHTDGPVWLVICTEVFIRQAGSMDFLDRPVPYLDGGEGPVLEYLTKALSYLARQCGEHGLCLIGDGDWNDPMNGVGRQGKGESVWLSMALVYAVHRLLTYLEKRDPDHFESLLETAEKMKASVNTYAWSEKQYAAAFCDNGERIGDCGDRLFLNTQSWALMSGTAEGERKDLLLDTVRELETPFGPLILSKPFENWDPRWGRLSVKKSGTTENGSVYCHASMFLAFAKAILGDGDGLYELLWRTLPTNPENPPEKNLQAPVYLANYYYGLRDSANFGRSSGHYGTGTAPWMLMLLVEELMGVRAGVDGLRLRPCLPSGWKKVSVCRGYKNAEYQITIKRGDHISLRVNGELYEKEILPYEENKRYQIEMTVV